jgi:hypothetical protein
MTISFHIPFDFSSIIILEHLTWHHNIAVNSVIKSWKRNKHNKIQVTWSFWYVHSGVTATEWENVHKASKSVQTLALAMRPENVIWF